MPLPAPSCMPIFFPNGPGCPFPRRYLPRWRSGGAGRRQGQRIRRGDLANYVTAAPGVAIFSGNDANPAATMRAGGAGVISGRSSAYPEVYAALRHQPGEQGRLDRIVALGASIGRIKHALQCAAWPARPPG